MLPRLMLLWLCLLSAAAFLWPRLWPWGAGAFDPFTASRPALNGLFAVTMFAIGWMLPRDEIRQVVIRWPTVLGGTLIQYGAMPLLAYVMGRLWGLGEDALLGIVLVGCVPGAMASNVLTLMARGNVSYSLSLTTAATLVSPLCVPLALWVLLATSVEFPTAGVSWQLTWMVVLPVLLGHALGRMLPRWQRAAMRIGPVVANLTILWIIAVVVGLNRENLLEVDFRLLAALASLNIAGYAAGYSGGLALRLPAPMRRALVLEVGMQNAGLGTVLALGMFSQREAVAIAPAIYTFGCMLTGTVLARTWAGMSEPEGDRPQRAEKPVS